MRLKSGPSRRRRQQLHYRDENDTDIVEVDSISVDNEEVVEYKNKALCLLCWITPNTPEDRMALAIDAVSVTFYSLLYHLLSSIGTLSEHLRAENLESLGSNNIVPSYTTMSAYSPCFANAGLCTLSLSLGWMLSGYLIGGYSSKNTVEGTMERSCLTAGMQFVVSLPIWLGMAYTSQTFCGCEASIHGGLLPEDLALIGGMLCVLSYSRMGWNYVHNQML